MSRAAPRALIIDDDPFLLKGLDFVLRKLGIEPVHTREAARFVELAEAEDFELLLVDLSLASGETGLALVERVRAIRGRGPRIVILSATQDLAVVREALERGADDYIVKPLESEHLAAKLRRYVSTAALAELNASLEGAAQGRSSARLTLAARVVEIDDRGVRLRGRHYLMRDSVMVLGGELVREIVGAAEAKPRAPASCLVKVLSSWPEDGGGYGAYAEFDRVAGDVRWHRALRRWLATRG